MSMGIVFSPIVLSWISEYGNFSIIKALLTTCLRFELSIKIQLVIGGYQAWYGAWRGGFQISDLNSVSN